MSREAWGDPPEVDQREPDVSEDEAWYDAEIAPALGDLAKRCHERGMAFVAVVEYQPGDRGRTVYMTEHAGLQMQMVNLCAATVPNVDCYVMNVLKYCKQRGIDTSGSIVLKQFGA